MLQSECSSALNREHYTCEASGHRSKKGYAPPTRVSLHASRLPDPKTAALVQVGRWRRPAHLGGLAGIWNGAPPRRDWQGDGMPDAELVRIASTR